MVPGRRRIGPPILRFESSGGVMLRCEAPVADFARPSLRIIDRLASRDCRKAL